MTNISTSISTKDIIYELAKGVLQQKTPTTYGRMRSKLNKQGFSEIALYSAAARHCEENSIPPQRYISEMIKLIDGCGRDLFFPRTHNDYHYLRGQYHDIRNGNLEKGESKSPEQRGLFLCNTCFQIKDKKERSKNANEKYTCVVCKSDKAKGYYEKSKSKPNPTSETSESQKNTNELEVSAPSIQAIQESEKVTKTASESNKSEEKKSFAHLLGGRNVSEPEIKITEIIADEKGASVTINCPTTSLHLALSALSELTQNE